MKLPDVSISFVWIILLCGVISLLVIAGNLLFLGLHRYPADPKLPMPGAVAELGKRAMVRHGCGGCHVIPGIPGARGRVGPSLDRIHEQVYVGGVLANTPENMARWIRSPKSFSRVTAMPDLPLTEEEARNIAAYLFGVP